MPSIFAKCGYTRNTQRQVLYGPLDYCGGRFIRWRWLQGEGRITNFLKNWRTKSQLGTTLRIAVAWYQYAAGVSWSLFEDVHTPMDYTHARWLPSLRKFLGTIDGYFDLDDTYFPPPQREFDVPLMDIVTRSDAFTPNEARIINYCRQHTTNEMGTLGCRVTPLGHLPGVLFTIFSIMGWFWRRNRSIDE
jgi:hypothetical protein